jgi:endogenous inhibitor of DNA gyrase (YacG/DUF329 family)
LSGPVAFAVPAGGSEAAVWQESNGSRAIEASRGLKPRGSLTVVRCIMSVLLCPICRRTIAFTSHEEVPYRPFCSQRCQQVDLGRWLNEEYRISEVVPPGETEEERSRPGDSDDGDTSD